MLKIQRKYRMNKVCFDRTGVGDAASELFSEEIPMEEVITSLPKKIEMINFLHSLFQNKKLLIKDKKLYDQVLEQEKHISDAGNLLYKHPSNKHDDIFWALSYACYASRNMLMGYPNHSMKRVGRDTSMVRSKIDTDLHNMFGSGWNITSR